MQIYLNGPSGTIDSPLVDRFQFQLGSDTNYSSTQNDTSNPDQLVSMILGSNEFVLNSDISSAPTIQYFGLIGGGTSFINSSSSGNEFNGVDLLGFSGVNLPDNLGNGFGKLYLGNISGTTDSIWADTVIRDAFTSNPETRETLVPPADSEGSAITLDGTYTSVNDIAWTVELSDRTDIFVGRDSVADSASSTGYLPGIETVIATGGNDEIDGGGGYNVADFSQMDAHWPILILIWPQVRLVLSTILKIPTKTGTDFQEVLGTDQNDNIYGTGEEDDELAEVMGSFDFGTNVIEFGAGSNDHRR